MKTIWIAAAALAALGVAGVAVYLRLQAVPTHSEGAPAEGRLTNGVATVSVTPTNAPVRNVRAPVTGKVARVAIQATNGVAVAAQPGRTEDERSATEMRDLLDGGNEKEALRIARRLIDSPDVDVRFKVVTVLGWVGVRALPDLTQMLADEDEGVAADAFTQWKMAYNEITDEPSKAELLVAAMGTMKDEADMEALVISFSELPTDLAVRSLVQIIQGANPDAGEVAREHYQFMTQTDYSTPEAAEQWIRENVEPDDAETVTK